MLVRVELKKDRLTALANFLDTVPDGNFNIHIFQSGRGTDEFVQGLIEHKCGYTACAIGYMPFVDPKNWSYVSRSSWPVCKILDGSYLCTDDAYCAYFGMSQDEFAEVFIPRVGESPERVHVVDFLRRLVAASVGEVCNNNYPRR